MEETKETQADKKQEVPEKSSEAASEKKEVAEESTPEKPEATDKHGNDAIAKGKYQRDMQAKDDEISDLKNQIAESAKTEKGRKELETKIAALEGTQAEMRTEYELKLAGCRDDKALKAAKALISDCDGDVTKLKAECPYLFAEEKKKGSTGFKPEGAAERDLDAKLDKAFGLKK